MTCPACGSDNFEFDGEDSMGNEMYECLNCGEQFYRDEAGE